MFRNDCILFFWHVCSCKSARFIIKSDNKGERKSTIAKVQDLLFSVMVI